MARKPRIILLGAGPAGLGAAFQLARKDLAHVKVLELCEGVGGSAGSFEISGIHVDYGSHRLHPSCDPEILSDIQQLLGNDLLERPRHGRIRLCGRWIHFPLKPLDLALGLPLSFSLGVASDLIGKLFRKKPAPSEVDTFASVLQTGLGRTICNNFYFPYSKKLWGLTPKELSSALASRRVSANSTYKMFRKLLCAVPGIRKDDGDRFYYPRNGFGQISECLYQAAHDSGAEFLFGVRVKEIQWIGEAVNEVCYERGGEYFIDAVEHLWSTISMPDLLRYMKPPPPAAICEASQTIEYRSMIFIYLLVEQGRFTEFDAHYFPEPDIPITRVSEPKNYQNAREPRNLTVLCAELPCSTNDPEWRMTDNELGELVCDCLKSASIQVKVPLNGVVTRRLSHAYPVYQRDYEHYFDQIDHWVGRVKNLLSFGRQGLFAHDNVHHALQMAYAAVDCLDLQGRFDRNKWQGHYRKIFKTYTVED
jgi:protoporphyrinogen oxidase